MRTRAARSARARTRRPCREARSRANVERSDRKIATLCGPRLTTVRPTAGVCERDAGGVPACARDASIARCRAPRACARKDAEPRSVARAREPRKEPASPARKPRRGPRERVTADEHLEAERSTPANRHRKAPEAQRRSTRRVSRSREIRVPRCPELAMAPASWSGRAKAPIRHKPGRSTTHASPPAPRGAGQGGPRRAAQKAARPEHRTVSSPKIARCPQQHAIRRPRRPSVQQHERKAAVRAAAKSSEREPGGEGIRRGERPRAR